MSISVLNVGNWFSGSHFRDDSPVPETSPSHEVGVVQKGADERVRVLNET